MMLALNRAAAAVHHDFDPPRARELRSRLVEQLERSGEVRDERILAALLSVPRHLFVPPELSFEYAYADRSIPIGHGQALAPPSSIARMTEALELSGAERVLEIGTGSGYHAAILSALAAGVDSIELLAPLARRAATVLAELGCANVVVRIGDGNDGWPRRGPFDRVLSGAASEQIPRAWIDQLRSGGILVAPVGGAWGGQRLTRTVKSGGPLVLDDWGPVAFVPLLSR